MSDVHPPEEAPRPSGIPEAQDKKRPRVLSIWIVPIVAAALVGYLVYTSLATRGPTITVTFETASGLREEQTEVKHKSVSLGIVERIELSEGADHVIAHIRMDARAEPMLTEQARFWVVRPRLKGGALAALQTGLETLVSGAYIELDPGEGGDTPHESFKGLEQPPAVRAGEPGTVFVLKTEEVGSLSAGSPVLYRKVAVGELLDVNLNDELGSVSMRAFVRRPHDRMVREATRFWNASGLRVGMGAEGLQLEIESVRSMFSGGIAFATPESQTESPRAGSGHTFRLYESEALAEIHMHGPTVPYLAYFRESVQGLAKGSPVRLFGFQVGNVTDMRLVADPDGTGIAARVAFVLMPERALSETDAQALYPQGIREQVATGMRVVLETSSFITGEKVLTLSHVNDSRPVVLAEEDGALVLPSHARGFSALTDAMSDVATRINKIPFEEIGDNLNRTLRSVDQTLTSSDMKNALVELAKTLEEVRHLAQEAREGLGPAFERLPQIAENVDEAVQNANSALGAFSSTDGDFQRGAQRLMNQISDMARSVRILSDYLQRHPEALIRGREQKEKP